MYSRISDEDSFIKAQSEERFDVDGRQEIEERLGNEAQENRDVITPQQRRGLRRRRYVVLLNYEKA